MLALERERPISEENFLVVSAYHQGIPLQEIDLLQTPHQELKPKLRGKRSEIRTKVLLSTIPIIKRVVWATRNEDHKLKIDLWAYFLEDSGHDRVPIQVKSTQHNINEFLNGPYADDRRIIGINAGPFNTNFGVISDFKKQLMEIDGFL